MTRDVSLFDYIRLLLTILFDVPTLDLGVIPKAMWLLHLFNSYSYYLFSDQHFTFKTYNV